MKWSDVNLMLASATRQSGKQVTVWVIRPFNAMPLWFKRFVKGLNQQHNLAANLALKPKNGRKRKLATVIDQVVQPLKVKRKTAQRRAATA